MHKTRYTNNSWQYRDRYLLELELNVIWDRDKIMVGFWRYNLWLIEEA